MQVLVLNIQKDLTMGGGIPPTPPLLGRFAPSLPRVLSRIMENLVTLD